jgi:uncharacterized protein (TIGR02001 family)
MVLALGGLWWSGARAEVSAELTMATDYVWRGVSQTDGKPALQLGAEYSHPSGFFAGVWGSNVDFDEDVDDPARVEIDLYAGWRGETAWGLGWEAKLLRYLYPDTTVSYDYAEITLAVSYGIARAEVAYSNDAFASGEPGVHYNAGLEHELALPLGLTLAGSVGYSRVDQEVTGAGNPESWVDWQVRVSRELWGLDVGLAYTDTNGDGERIYGRWARPRLVLTVSKAF